MALGIFLQRLLVWNLERAPLIEPDTAHLRLMRGTSDALIYTDSGGKIVSVSANLLRLLDVRAQTDLLGLLLEPALGMQDALAATLVQEIRQLGYIRDRALTVYDQKKRAQTVWLTAAANWVENEFTGADIVLRVNIQGDAPDAETRALAAQIYARSGELQVQNLDLFKTYCVARIHLLASLLVNWGGPSLSHVMEEMFITVAQSQHSGLQFVNGELLIPPNETQKSLLKVMPALLATLTHYTEDVAGFDHTRDAILALESEFEPASLRTLQQFGLLIATLELPQQPLE
jgi:hypothetical protein